MRASLFFLFDRIHRRASNALSALHQGIWLGLLGRAALHEVAMRQYLGWDEYRDPAYNRSGLYAWEESVVERYFSDCRSLLVTAAGGGREVLALLERGFAVEAFECSPGLVEAGNRLLEECGREASIELAPPDRVPESAGSHGGAIVGWGAYMHVPGRAARVALLRQLAARLPAGGPILLSFYTRPADTAAYRTIAATANLLRRLRLDPDRVERGDTLAKTFDHHFTEAELRAEVEAAGLELVHFARAPYPHAVARVAGAVPAGDEGAGGPSYIHGTEPGEQARLSRLNEILNPSSLAKLRLAGGERVLDVGSGLGQLSREIARAVGPRGRVVGVERDARQLAEARRRAAAAGEEGHVEFRPGEAVAPPLTEAEWGTFDLAHCRFLLEHVPDPAAVVAAMVRAVRPGGRVVLEDDDHEVLRLHPAAPAVDRLWRAYFETYGAMGNDPYVGRRLVELLRRAGARPTETDILFFGSCAGRADFDLLIDNFQGILTGAREAILEAGGKGAASSIGAAEFERAIEELERWRRRPDAALWYGTCWAEGIRTSAADRRGDRGPTSRSG